MSLSVRDRRALDSIDSRLSGSDPHLAGLLGIFTRLTAGEEMPAREQIRLKRAAGGSRRVPRRRGPGARPPMGRGPAGLSPARVMLLLWLLIAVALISVAIVMNAGGPGPPCRAAWTMGCVTQAPGAASHGGRP